MVPKAIFLISVIVFLAGAIMTTSKEEADQDERAGERSSVGSEEVESEEEGIIGIEEERVEYLWDQMDEEDDRGMLCKFYNHVDILETVPSFAPRGYDLWFSPYIVVDYENPDIEPFIRLDVAFIGDDWLFMRAVRLVIDGEVEYLEFDQWEVETDVWTGGTIYEGIDLTGQDELLRLVADADEVIVVIMGSEGRAEFELDECHFDMITEVLEFYDYVIMPDYERDEEGEDERIHPHK